MAESAVIRDHRGMPNAATSAYWAEEAGPRWVRDRARHDAELAPMLDALLAAADPHPGERVLDVGCGAGTSTLAVAARVAPTGSVVGVDVSPPLLAELERRVREPTGQGQELDVRVLCADAQDADLPGPFDLLVSRMGVMFFDDQVAAWSNLRRAMVPGGRAVAVVWQEQSANPWMAVPARAALAVSPSPDPVPGPGAAGPHGLADADLTTRRLTAAGWTDVALAGIRPVIQVGPDLDAAVTQVSALGSVGAAVERAGADRVLPAVRAALEPYVSEEGPVRMQAAAWVVTARAGSPA